MSPALRIQELFYGKIPITRALGVRVEEYDGRRLVVVAPLGENVNHVGSAFGGSLNVVAVLSGYGLLWLELQESDCHIVIRESSISYDRPVRGDIRAVCVRPESAELEAFKQRFRQKGRARIALSSTVGDGGVAAARFRGTFVAMRSAGT